MTEVAWCQRRANRSNYKGFQRNNWTNTALPPPPPSVQHTFTLLNHSSLASFLSATDHKGKTQVYNNVNLSTSVPLTWKEKHPGSLDYTVLMASGRRGSHVHKQPHALEDYMWNGEKSTKSNVPVFNMKLCSVHTDDWKPLQKKPLKTLENKYFVNKLHPMSILLNFSVKVKEYLVNSHEKFLYLCVFCLCSSSWFGKLGGKNTLSHKVT